MVTLALMMWAWILTFIGMFMHEIGHAFVALTHYHSVIVYFDPLTLYGTALSSLTENLGERLVFMPKKDIEGMVRRNTREFYDWSTHPSLYEMCIFSLSGPIVGSLSSLLTTTVLFKLGMGSLTLVFACYVSLLVQLSNVFPYRVDNDGFKIFDRLATDKRYLYTLVNYGMLFLTLAGFVSLLPVFVYLWYV